MLRKGINCIYKILQKLKLITLLFRDIYVYSKTMKNSKDKIVSSSRKVHFGRNPQEALNIYFRS